ncbi:M56 family metallopeptidase [Rufibacter ruber]|uniref:M56 family metallopeptidase n=1 Tax=Rufibacter ruber TaxID=1783499 RepID=UPI00083368E6|nr:M56 family metallopeptidase [Rufibacter ruber]
MNDALLQYLLESTGVLLLFYLFFVLVLRKETSFQFNRFYLLGALLLAVVLPLLQLPVVSLFAQPAEPVAEAVPVAFAVETADVAWGAQVQVEDDSLGYWLVLYLLYGAGALFFAGRLAFQLVQLHRFAHKEGSVFFLADKVPVYYTNGRLPTFSFLRSIYFDNSQPLTTLERDQILEHEQVHIAQCHSWDILFASLLGIVFWFNPLLVLYKRALEETHEFIADARVVSQTDTQVYSSLLLKQVFQKLDLSVASYFFFNKSLTLSRIKMMKKQHHSPRFGRLLLVVPFLLGLVVLVAATRPASLVPLSPQQQNASGWLSFGAQDNQSAQFPGGQEGLKQYVKSHFYLPAVAFELRRGNDPVRVVGSVEVEVKADGSAVFKRPVQLEVSPNHAKVQEAVRQEFSRMVASMPKWSPAVKDGKAVASSTTITIASVSTEFVPRSANAGVQQKTQVSTEANLAGITRPAEFPGGEGAKTNFIASNFQLPELLFELREDRNKPLTFAWLGKAEVLINKDGYVSQVTGVSVESKPLHSAALTSALVRELAAVIKRMPRWSPALENGKPVPHIETISLARVHKVLAGQTFAQYKAEQAKKAKAPAASFATTTTAEGDKIYIAVEKMPEFPGGQKAMFKYLAENFVMPKEAMRQGVHGTMIASFVVTNKGNITQVEVLKSLNPELGKEMVRVITAMPNWEPGTQNGKPVAVRYTIPYRIAQKDSPAKDVPFAAKAVAEDKVYIAVEQMPVYPGGITAMMIYLKEQVGNSEEVRQLKVNGSVVASFVVDTAGVTKQVQVLKKLHPVVDQQVVKAIEGMPKWQPGKQNGKAVNVKYTLPYRFEAN